MRILITGINGFIGQHLATTLIKKGHSVVGLGHNKVSKVEGLSAYYSGSVLDKNLISQLMKDVEVVVHLAALTAHADIIDNKFQTLEINLLGTKNILDAFSESKVAKKFIYSSTGKVYGKIDHLPITEDSPTNPLNILGKSKLITEKIIDFYNCNEKELIILRMFNIYGTLQKENFLIPTILNQIQHGKKEILLGDTKAKRDYVHIDDVINAFVLTIETEGDKGLSTYNISTGIGNSAEDIVKIINAIKGLNIKIQHNSNLIRRDEMEEEYGSYEKIQKKLGWKPTVTIQEGINRLLNIT